MAAEEDIEALKRQLAEAQVNANRWLAVCQRHGVALTRRFLGTSDYNSKTAQGLLDKWADQALAEIKAYLERPREVQIAECKERIAQLEQEMLGSDR